VNIVVIMTQMCIKNNKLGVKKVRLDTKK
jgi:hypothetical protein